MAATSGIPQANWDFRSAEQGTQDALKLSLLMEKLRMRSNMQRSWADNIKAIRAAMSDKRHQSEAMDRSQLQRWLETLQKAMRVLSQLTLVEQLEAVARQVGLKFTPPCGPDAQLFVSSDMFYVQVFIDNAGMAKDVKIAHQGEPQSCQDLQEVLSRGDFTEFTSHLEGLCQIYNISGDKKQKTKTFLALQALEQDLNMLAQLQSSINGVANYIYKSPLGILLPRKGGRPMKLIYFVSPYDLLDRETKTKHPLTVEAITEHQLGQSVTVSIEHSALTRLQTMPLMTVNKTHDGKSLPSFPGLSNVNSCMLPACFMLTLPSPLPVLASLVKKIESVTNIEVPKLAEGHKLLPLLIETVSKGQLVNENELYVTLPDQQHLYFLGGHHGWMEEEGVLITKIPFTHPTSLPQILVYLRQQVLFNTVLSSCIRPSAKQDPNSAIVFELFALSLQQVNVSFEHPLQDSMVTAEFDLSDITNIKCRVCTAGDGQSFCSDEYASKVFHKCMSIPVSLRAIVNKVLGQLKRTSLGRPSVHTRHSTSRSCWSMGPMSGDFCSQEYSPQNYSMDLHCPSRGISRANLPPRNMDSYDSGVGILDSFSAPPELLDSVCAEKVARNPLLATLLDQESATPDIHNSPMLSKLLDDQTKTATGLLVEKKPKKGKKRRALSSDIPGRSPKQKFGEDKNQEKLIEIDSSSPAASSVHSCNSTPPETLRTAVIDLTDVESYDCDSPAKKVCVTLNEPQGGVAKDLETPKVVLSDVAKQGSESKSDSKNGSASLEELLNGSEDVTHTINPDDYTNKTTKSGDFLENGTLSRNNSESQSTFPADPLDFDTDLLNSDHVFPDHLIDNSEEMDLEMCDASAFGTGISAVALIGSKLTGNPVSSVIEKEFVEEKNIAKAAGYENKSRSNCDSDADIPGMKEEMKSEETGVMKLKLYTNESKKAEKSATTQEGRSKDDTEACPRSGSRHSANEHVATTLKISSPQKHMLNSRSKSESLGKSERSSKKRDSRHSSSAGETSKRHRDKDESKKERKKRRQEKNQDYSGMVVQEAVYRSTPVESSSDSKPMPRLKITKSILKLPVEESLKISSSKQNLIDTSKKGLLQGFGNKSVKYIQSEKSSSKEVGQKTQRSLSTSQNITVNKADSKLMTKTPTVKLKPLVMPTSGSSVNVSSVRTPVSSSASHTTSKGGGSSASSTPSSSSPRVISPSGKATFLPLITKSSSCSSPSATASSGSSSGSNSKAKALNRSRKGSLSAVIDKLTKTSTTSVHVSSANDEPLSATSEGKETDESASWSSSLDSDVSQKCDDPADDYKREYRLNSCPAKKDSNQRGLWSNNRLAKRGVTEKGGKGSKCGRSSSTSKLPSRENGRYSKDPVDSSSGSPDIRIKIEMKGTRRVDAGESRLAEGLCKSDSSDGDSYAEKSIGDGETANSPEPADLDDNQRGISESNAKDWNRFVGSGSGSPDWLSDKGQSLNGKQFSLEKSGFERNRDCFNSLRPHCQEVDSNNSSHQASGTKNSGLTKRPKGNLITSTADSSKFNGETPALSDFDFDSHDYNSRTEDDDVEISNCSGDAEKQSELVKECQQGAVVKRKSRTLAMNAISPRSDASSPDNGLVIDCPSTQHSPCFPHDSRVDSKRILSQSCTLSPQPKNSPLPPSPTIKDIQSCSNPASVSSGCIDDDLFDDALMTVESVP